MFNLQRWSSSHGRWKVGTRYEWATCGYCLNGKCVPEDYISLIATHPMKKARSNRRIGQCHAQ